MALFNPLVLQAKLSLANATNYKW